MAPLLLLAEWEKFSPHTSCSLLPLNLKNPECGIKDCPFTLDYITDLPRYVDQNHYQTAFDNKSGYDHMQFHPSSSTYFGFQWGGWYFSYATLPFGWKARAYISHMVGMAATHFTVLSIYWWQACWPAAPTTSIREPVFQLPVSTDGCFCCLFSTCLPRLLYRSQKKCLNTVYLSLVFGLFVWSREASIYPSRR